MKFTRFALLAFAATVGLAACSEDPTEAGQGEPFAIVTDVAQATTPRNTQLSIRAYTIDQNNRRIPGALTAQPAGPAISIDSTVYVQELSETRFFVRGTTASAAGTDLTITGHGLTATSKIIVQ
jgi:hypothetical protein